MLHEPCFSRATRRFQTCTFKSTPCYVCHAVILRLCTQIRLPSVLVLAMTIMITLLVVGFCVCFSEHASFLSLNKNVAPCGRETPRLPACPPARGVGVRIVLGSGKDPTRYITYHKIQETAHPLFFIYSVSCFFFFAGKSFPRQPTAGRPPPLLTKDTHNTTVIVVGTYG